MGTRKRRSDRAGRGILRSPGRPGVARREDRRRFWAAIAAGLTSEDAARGAGVSPAVGTRWFREAGGHATSGACAFVKAALRAVSVVRGTGGDRAMSRAGPWGTGGGPPAGAGSLDDLAGTATQRRHARR